MAAWTLEEAQRRLTLYLNAEEAILTGNQEITVMGTTYRRADLDVISKRIEYWRNEVERLEASTPRGPVFRTTRIIGR